MLCRMVSAALELAVEWFSLFMADADEQAGRPRGSSAHETPSPDDVQRRIDQGCVWFWVDEAGERVHLTAANPPSNRIYEALGYRPVVDMANLVIR